MKVVSVALVMTVVFTGVRSDYESDKLTPEQIEQVLFTHNQARSAVHGANELQLEWDETLAEAAYQLAETCTYDHGFLDVGDFGRVGQNIYATSSLSFDETAIDNFINGWVSEKQYYNIADQTCAAGHQCGHFTQVVWGGTSKVGCAYKKCNIAPADSAWIISGVFVCNYHIPGNQVGYAPYETGVPCGRCDEVVSAGNAWKCLDKLCTICEDPADPDCQCPEFQCYNEGSKVGCGCDCTSEFFGNECQYACGDVAGGNCAAWAGLCNDSMYGAFMREQCAKTCNLIPAGACPQE